MLEIKITAPELTEAINNFSKAMIVLAEKIPNGMPTTVAPTNITGAAVEVKTPEVVSTAPNSTPVVPTATAQAPVTTAPAEEPTTEYTLEAIAKAGTALIDAGKMGELMALLAKYGVETLTALPTANYPAFVTELRGLGAEI